MRMWIPAIAAVWIAAATLVSFVSASDAVHEPTRTPILGDARLRAAANRIDFLVESEAKRSGTTLSPLVDDATFARRVWLDTIGRIPSADEADAFLASQDPQKRAHRIDALLYSRAADSHDLNWWADLLRATSRFMNMSGDPYLHWLGESIRDDKPYDELVTELLTAEGAALERGNGATGYFLRDRGMPLDNLANTTRIFLGTQLGCAQCHDHPFDRWTQREFYEMAAFMGGMQFRQRPDGRVREAREEVRTGGGRSSSENTTSMQGGDSMTMAGAAQGPSAVERSVGRILLPTTFGIGGSGTGMIRLPKDYAYEDGKPNEWIRAKTIFGDDATLDYDDEPRRRSRNARANRNPRPRPRDSRAAFAEWLTSPENPRFTTVIANRMWKRVMGRGLIDAVDDLRDDTVASNPKLMEYLEELMVELDYDLREFRRVLFHTRSYQRAATPEPAPGEPDPFRGPTLRRLSAEQLWDSLVGLVRDDVDATLQDPGAKAERSYANYDQLMTLTSADVAERARLRTQEPEKYRALVRREAQPMGAASEALQRARSRGAELRAKQREFREARKAKDRDAIQAARTAIAELRAEAEEARRERSLRGFVRASELPSPAPPGHFLREFGQSDREQIQDARDDATVPQALNLLNGFVETSVLGDAQSRLVREIAEVATPGEAIRVAYLNLLTREPRDDEVALWRTTLDSAASTDEALADLVWTLANSHEFRFRQ